MRTASIDIGTNTILLLIADLSSDGTMNVLYDEQVIARLGKGVDGERMIRPETFDRVAGFLKRYKEICDSMNVGTIRAVGTSAVRDARNREEFIAAMKERSGIAIEVLSGDDEAQWTYRGGISEFKGRAERFSVIDIGGGSTEIIVGDAERIISKTSIDIGSVRITERILKESPPEASALIDAHDLIASMIPADAVREVASTFAVGVAGTLTTLAAFHHRLPVYQPEKVTGTILTPEIIGSAFGILKDKTSSQIAAFPQISEGRADIILAGILILMGYMEAGALKQITVSDRGLRYGILYREMERSF